MVSFFQNGLIVLFALLILASIGAPIWSIVHLHGKVSEEKYAMAIRPNAAGQVVVTEEWKKSYPETKMSINPL
jgi:hypothetical protein